MGGYQSTVTTGMYPPSQPPPQWNNYTPSTAQAAQPGTVPSSSNFFPQQGIGQRFPSERPGTQSRQALSNMLRQRQHPNAQFVPGTASVSNTSITNPVVSGTIPSSGAGGMTNNPRVTTNAGGGNTNQQQFPNMSMIDAKQRQQQQFIRQMRQQHASGAVFNQQGTQSQQTPPQQQQQLSMTSGGFANIHTPMNQNFNMFPGATQPGMQQLGNPQQQQAQQQQPPPPQQQQQPQPQGMMGQHFSQG